MGHLGPQFEILEHTWTTQVQIAITKTIVICHFRIILDFKRSRLGSVENDQVADLQFHSSSCQLVIGLLTCLNGSCHLNYVLRS